MTGAAGAVVPMLATGWLATGWLATGWLATSWLAGSGPGTSGPATTALATTVLATAVLVLYYAMLGTLSLYGLHRVALVAVYLATRYRATRRRAPIAEPPADDALPSVTVQLPLYNEMYVARRLIDAVCRLDYPRSKLEVQVLDDSTDETTAIVGRAVAQWRRRGVAVHHLHRMNRGGYKAGALAAGAAAARGELLAVFDADFVPAPDFLRRAVAGFADPGRGPGVGVGPGIGSGICSEIGSEIGSGSGSEIGMVQARWEHLNRDYSLLTRVQAMLLDGHFVVEHAARHRGGCFFNFNGTAGVWRREAIAGAGGWQHDTLTEDLDLSYRAQLAGWRFVYLPELTVPGELPVDVNGFKSQQFRWAKGSIQTARKLLGPLLRSPLPVRVKLEAAVHLTNNVSYLLMVALSLLLFPAMLIRRGVPPASLLAVDLPLFAAATVSVLVFYAAAQAGTGRRGWWRELRLLPALMALGIGLSINNARAVVSGWRAPGGAFVRTPKYRIERRGQVWRGKRYRAGRGPVVVAEGAMAVYLLGCTLYAISHGMWISLPFLWLFLQGYGLIFLLGVAPGARHRRRVVAPAGGEAVSKPAARSGGEPLPTVFPQPG